MSTRNVLQGFRLPKSINLEHVDVSKNFGRFEIYPFERGFGSTIGNTLRRVLLSSIQGYAVYAVKFVSYDKAGAPHVISNEFESIPGVAEDTSEIIDNLKHLRLKLDGEARQFTIDVTASEATEEPTLITGANIDASGVEISNPEQLICTLMPGTHLEIELQAMLGRGFVPSEENRLHIEEIGCIATDSIFSPVQKVVYKVENHRVGQRGDFDKLILDIYTDGTIAPENALGEGALIIKEHMSIFINFDDSMYGAVVDETPEEAQLKALLASSIEELEFSVRPLNCLHNADIMTVGDLIKLTEPELAKTRNFGKKSLQEIKDKLEERGLELGMTDFTAILEQLKG